MAQEPPAASTGEQRGTDDIIGQTLGRYRIEHLLGSGGMGQVYLAIQPQIGSRVAVKVLSHECARDHNQVERFFNEARAVNKIQHDGIVSVLDLATLPDGRPYIVMEYLDGASVADLIKNGPLPLETLTALALQTLEALRASHSKQVVHRDLKPENLMVTSGGRLKVLDFGIAKLVPEGAPATTLTQAGMLLGTPAYMAPEQILGERVDARTDVYAMGVILFEGATGRQPFTGRTLYELFEKQMNASPPRPSSLRPDLPPSYEAIILRALAKRPEQRFQSAAEMAAALKAVSAGGSLNVSTANPSAPAALGPTLPPQAAGRGPTLPPQPRSEALGPTLPPHTGPGLARAARPPRTGLWIGLSVAGVLVLAGLAAAGITMLRSCASSIGSGAHLATGTGNTVSLGILEPDFDPTRFRPIKYLERAQGLARQVADDMQLTTFNINGVLPDGHADLTLSSHFTAIYGFRSPTLSKVDPSKPVNLQERLPCLVTVMVSAREVRVVRQVSFRGCKEEILSPWSCTIAQAFARARSVPLEAGVPRGDNIVASVTWWKSSWVLSFGSDRTVTVAGDCSRVK